MVEVGGGRDPMPMEILKSSCRHIMRTLGTGHREAVYHAALITALNKARVFHRSETVCAITYLGETVGYGKADLILDDLVVELKATTRPPAESSGQLKKYVQSLTRSEQRPFRGVVINFNQRTTKVDFFEDESQPVERKPVPIKHVVRSRFWTKERKSIKSTP
jgi:GxxExxY protein